MGGVKKVLIAEDEIDLMQIFMLRLKAEGYEVFNGFDGEEVVRLIENEMPDLILLDLMLPKIDGFEICRKVKTDERLKHISIVVLSALSEQKNIDKAKAAGADSYITKPFELNELIAEVRDRLR